MKDSFGRTIDYLRISLIDHCNLRCLYCMPMAHEAMLKFVPRDDLLTPAEIEAIARAAALAGFRKIRLTGGEPTLRPDVVEIVQRVAAVPGIDQVVMTTNGTRLPHLAADLKAAGLSRVNVHVDTLNPEHLPKLMRQGRLDRIWAGIQAAEEAGLVPLKLNAAVTRGYNDEDVAGLARLTLEHPWQVRFIELMPLGTQAQVALDRCVSSAETMARIEAELGPLVPEDHGRLDGEAVVYRLAGAPGTVGFISPVSVPYCGNCNRMRVTADGRIRLCLLSDREIDFRGTLRAGGTVDDLVALFKRAVRHKPWGHKLAKGEHPELRTMSQIGG